MVKSLIPQAYFPYSFHFMPTSYHSSGYLCRTKNTTRMQNMKHDLYQAKIPFVAFITQFLAYK
ncbi:CLUMA_CG012450, isoform A [Clunio marinus]|uniref:CLUMA_CG012450, isoform A n=1 Tax=Clunio marinus TaxID=568069 RepID=A0A1J1IFR8_9DIPT|nr:CLUMA_CG012450, isoform A [Clunio marinus]